MFDFKDQFECYQAIAEALERAAPGGWDQIRVEARLIGDSVDTLVTSTSGDSMDSLTGVRYLARLIWELSRLVSTEEKGFFERFTFVLNQDGKYEADFSYPNGVSAG